MPTQARSRARVARILAEARALIAERGLRELRTSEVARRVGISIGSLYQYFPDARAIVRALAEEANVDGQRCTAALLAPVRTLEALPAALTAVAEGYLAMYVADPVLRDLWSATQVDGDLQAVDAEDLRAHSALFEATFARLAPGTDATQRAQTATLVVHLIASTVRLALARPPAERTALLAELRALLLDAVPGRLHRQSLGTPDAGADPGPDASGGARTTGQGPRARDARRSVPTDRAPGRRADAT